MKVHWTSTAERHLAAIHSYIARNSPEYAKRMVDRLTRRSQQIGEFPFSGRIEPVQQITIGSEKGSIMRKKHPFLTRFHVFASQKFVYWTGSIVPEYELPQIREVIEGPYRIVYHVKPDQIDVVGVLHGAMDVLREK